MMPCFQNKKKIKNNNVFSLKERAKGFEIKRAKNARGLKASSFSRRVASCMIWCPACHSLAEK